MKDVRIGILCFQGAFKEHRYSFEKATQLVDKDIELKVEEVRKPSHLNGLDGLVIPGGESTTMSIFLKIGLKIRLGLAIGVLMTIERVEEGIERSHGCRDHVRAEDFMESLRDWMSKKKAMWGTCAGLILLSNNVLDWKNNSQSLIGGLHVTTVRNSYGRQKDSFEAKLTLDEELGGEFPGIFIRAPSIKSIDSEDVRVLATLDRHPVSVCQNQLLATSFHPELTDDYRFHAFFINMCLNTPSIG
ncbi:DgyrCDS13095 [Dimorphilus gyrociliatus]|uniref:glutaminase n=1 Tax=Dimorphilus gyrociliatus TaxID=2664684 RepID=A0A7I8W9M8_9ANNE|nr:DgyrCDS13095 [Dimorphilus gyrociliatus]